MMGSTRIARGGAAGPAAAGGDPPPIPRKIAPGRLRELSNDPSRRPEDLEAALTDALRELTR